VSGVDPAVDLMAIGEDPVVDPIAIGEVRAVQAWRQSRSGCGSVGEIVARVRV
jgi:hypothetical protein